MSAAYDPIAPFYALEIADYDEDLEFYENLARRTGGPVLEAGAGTGRVARHLAAAGHTVTALEESDAMLEIARDHVNKSVTLVHGKIQALAPKQEFGLAIMAAGTFAHFPSRDDQRDALKAVQGCLRPGGVVVIALQNPYVWALEDADGRVLFGWEKPGPGPGEATCMSYSVETDHAAQFRRLSLWYDVAAPDGLVRRTSAAFELHWIYLGELELLLESCGFSPDGSYGSFDLDPYESTSPHLIVVAKKV
jgi:SAM-dependent methyltransferase